MLTTIHANINAKTGPLIKQLGLLVLTGLIWSSWLPSWSSSGLAGLLASSSWCLAGQPSGFQLDQLTNARIQYLQDPHSPSGGMLAFLRLSRSSVVSLATAVPLLVLLRTLKARFRRRKERLRTDVLSKLRSVNKCEKELSEKGGERNFATEHAWTCPSSAVHFQRIRIESAHSSQSNCLFFFAS